MIADPVVDVSFPLRAAAGATIPADHGYPLYAALSRQAPALHADETAGIHPVYGQLVGGRLLALTADSRVTLRLPASKLSAIIPLAGKHLDVAGSRVLLGVPTLSPLRPAATLRSRLVVVSGFLAPDEFLGAVNRQLAMLALQGTATLVARSPLRPLEGRVGSKEGVVRRTVRVRDKEIVGFAVQVSGLSSDDSYRLQAVGLGGRRRFGAGIFTPAPGGEREV